MPLDYSLLGKPINVMESLQALGQSQDSARILQEREDQMAKQQRFQSDLGGAINPTTGAVDGSAARLAYLNNGDAEGAIKFGQQQQTDFAAQRKKTAEPFAQAAWDVLQRDPAEQSAAWDQYVDQFALQYPAAAQFKGQYTPEIAKAFLAEVGLLDDYMKDTAPKATVIPQGGAIGFVQNGRRIDSESGQEQLPQQPTNGPPSAAPGTVNAITPQEARSVIQSLGKAGYDAWAQKNGIVVQGQGQSQPQSKKLSNGTTAYLVNGAWYDNPEGR